MSVVSGQGGAFCFSMPKKFRNTSKIPNLLAMAFFTWASTLTWPYEVAQSLDQFCILLHKLATRVMNFITHLIKLDWSNFGQTSLTRFIDTAGASRTQRMCLHCPPQILTCRVTHAPWPIPLLIIYPFTYLQALDMSKWSYIIGSTSQAIQNLYHKSLQSLRR